MEALVEGTSATEGENPRKMSLLYVKTMDPRKRAAFE
jgi:hypothetical protein